MREEWARDGESRSRGTERGRPVRVSRVGTDGWELAQNAGQFVNAVNLGPSASTGQVGTRRESSRKWQAVASRRDGSELVAEGFSSQRYSFVVLPSAPLLRQLDQPRNEVGVVDAGCAP